jgi:hypothetical protein
MAPPNPRIQAARNRAASVKRGIVYLSAAGFVTAFVLARAAHPGHASASQPAGNAAVPTTRQSSDDNTKNNNNNSRSLGFSGSGSIAPSQNVAPSVQTHTS